MRSRPAKDGNQTRHGGAVLVAENSPWTADFGGIAPDRPARQVNQRANQASWYGQSKQGLES